MIIKLTIIIVNYNTKDLVVQCLDSVKRACHAYEHEIGRKDIEVWVVDNASSDDIVEVVRRTHPWVTVAALKENTGFARANNAIMRRTKSEYVLLLNSDTIVGENIFTKMIPWMDAHSNVAVSTCRVEFPSGSLDPACHRGFPTPWASCTYMIGLSKAFPKSAVFGQYHQTYKDFSNPHEIDSGSGAFYLVRRSAIKEVGFLDERFFMYAEDLDWSKRFKEHGWKVWYLPISTVIHVKGQSGVSKVDPRTRLRTLNSFYRTMHTFYEKHYEKKYPKIISLLVHLGIDLRWMFAKLRV